MYIYCVLKLSRFNTVVAGRHKQLIMIKKRSTHGNQQCKHLSVRGDDLATATGGYTRLQAAARRYSSSTSYLINTFHTQFC